ncbi:SH3 domain-containing protein [Nostoc sp. FACHB-152]|uniref:SH3 domain-containing protein n=1 Tax=unclassified Nostoc TaxID=2593658 RepID=UPI0016844D23|nr:MULTISPECIES: SH3 domain-containing protein [unclassified Nostoc]MBD2447325.1 SH3 domain-containing protein [Nostoc sp. FACHB-152]MBD2468074.1 SH3 domain-containing protein [Nostoc sp. FACHB-145]
MLSGLLKLILGFVLAIAVLLGTGLTVALYFVNRTAIPPAKPTFVNDNPAYKKETTKEAKAESTSEPTPESSPTPTPSETPTPDELPPGAYQGRVTWSEGLSLRAEPNQSSEKVGGVTFNQKIIVLEENPDKTWVKIRLEGSKQEGWVKIGNIERTN